MNKKSNRIAKPIENFAFKKSPLDKSQDENHNQESTHEDNAQYDIFVCSEKIIKMSQHINKNLTNYNNEIYFDNVKLFHQFLNCSNFNDLVSLQEHLVQNHLKNFIDKTKIVTSELKDQVIEFSEIILKNYSKNP